MGLDIFGGKARMELSRKVKDLESRMIHKDEIITSQLKSLNKLQVTDNFSLKGAFYERINQLMSSVNSSFDSWENTSNTSLVNAFNSVPHLYDVVDYIISKASTVTMKMFEIKSDGKEEEIKDDKIIKLLEQPNPREAYPEFTANFLAYRHILGNSYINALKGATTSIQDTKELYVLPAQYVSIEAAKDFNTDFRFNEIKYYHMQVDNKHLRFEPDVILHSKNVNLLFENGAYFYGISPLVANSRVITTSKGEFSARNSIINKRGALGALVSGNDQTFDGEAAQSIQDKYHENYGLSEDQYKILVTGTNLKWLQMGLPIKELQLFEGMNFSLEDICRMYKFPQELLMSGVKFENKNEAAKMLAQNVIVPMMENYASELSRFFQLQGSNRVIRPDFSKVPELQQDKNKLSERYRKEIELSIITPFAAQKKLGYDQSKPAPDEYYMRSNIVPINNSNEET